MTTLPDQSILLRADNRPSILEPKLYDEPTPYTRPTKVEVPKELPKVSMAVEQHRVESKAFEVKINKVLNENERLLEQVTSKDILNILVNSSVNNTNETVHECKKCLKLETELQKDFIKKEIYDKLFKSYTTLEKHCISLEVDTQLNQELFQRDNSFYSKEDKIKKELGEIETINIELDHRVTKLIAENEHLKQTYNLQENVLVIIALKENLRKLKGKDVVDEAVISHPIDLEMLKVDVAPLGPTLQNNRIVHSDYIKHTHKETATLREIVKQERSLNPLNTSLDYAKNKEELEEEASRALERKSESSEEKAAKKQKLDEEVEELKKHLQIVLTDEDDVYIEATPLALKVPVVDYKIHTKNNKPYYKIIKADGTHQLFLSFLSLLRSFDKDDLEILWKIV
uniref:Uncharacterized protein n=1 Tax=Tanacetum cinerariifolium TaxID=118510 RepID=A0A6L2J3S7_TANCI|nr:hypothetical protein [Tanacetum cinerariifolium]